MWLFFFVLAACSTSQVALDWHRFEKPCDATGFFHFDEPLLDGPPVVALSQLVGYGQDGTTYYADTNQLTQIEVHPDGTWDVYADECRGFYERGSDRKVSPEPESTWVLVIAMEAKEE